MGPLAALAILLLLETEVPYALGSWRPPDLTTPGEPLTLYDLRYRVTDGVTTTHAFAARVKVGGKGFLGLDVDDENHRLTWASQRWDLAFGEQEGSYDLLGGYRAPRFIVETSAHRRSVGEGRGWLRGASVAGRLSSDRAPIGRFEGDSKPVPRTTAVEDRFARHGSLGLLYQGGSRLEAFAQASRSRLRTSGGVESERDRFELAAQAYARVGQLSTEAIVENSHGRFPRREVAASIRAEVPLDHLLFETQVFGRWERGGPRLEDRYRASLSWFGRRVRLARAGEAAARTTALAKRACALGYNERRDHDDAGRRALRERLSLSPGRQELAEELVALHQAQLAERNVPLLGLEFEDASDTVTAVRSRTWRAFVGAPWPLAPPWRSDEGASPFLRLSVERRRDLYGAALAVVEHAVALEAQLDRQMSLVVRWREGEPTPLDIVRGTPVTRTLELECAYAFGL
jgi:hypothetical protein